MDCQNCMGGGEGGEELLQSHPDMYSSYIHSPLSIVNVQQFAVFLCSGIRLVMVPVCITCSVYSGTSLLFEYTCVVLISKVS